MHELLFGISRDGAAERRRLADHRCAPLLVPSLGGLAFGLISYLDRPLWPRRAVDPIEANALYGGRMSLNDSLIVVLQTIMSNGVGASVGLEAGYTQIGAAIASRFGRSFRLRRNDLRVLVGCGAAGAIGGAFNAPLTGAFYAFELVIGTYTLAHVRAGRGGLDRRRTRWCNALGGAPFELDVHVPTRSSRVDYIPILALGMVCALVGIAIMRGVTLTEDAVPPQRRAGLAAPGDAAAWRSGCWRWSRRQCCPPAMARWAIVIDAPLSLPHIALLVVLKAVGLGHLASAPASAAACSSPRCSSARCSASCSPALLALVTTAHAVPAGGLRAGRHERAGRRHHRRAADHGVPGAGEHRQPAADHRGAGGLRGLGADGAAHLRLLVRHLALPSARRGDPQRGRYRLDAQPDGRADDAPRGAHGARRHTAGRVPPRFPAGRARSAWWCWTTPTATPASCCRPRRTPTPMTSHKVGDLLHYADTVLLPQMTIKEAVAMFENAESDALAVVDGPDTRT